MRRRWSTARRGSSPAAADRVAAIRSRSGTGVPDERAAHHLGLPRRRRCSRRAGGSRP
jgi:hypothetical protein